MAEACPRMSAGIICCIAVGAMPKGAAKSTDSRTSHAVAQAADGARNRKMLTGTSAAATHAATMKTAARWPWA